MRTATTKKQDVERRWFVVDATGQPLGRLASRIASVIRGKHRPVFQPHVDTGDFVVVVNAEKVLLTGDKLRQKRWYHYSRYPGGLRAEPYDALIRRRPEWIIEKAVYGMLPKNRLGRTLHRKLKVYRGPRHPHAAQKPQPLPL
ncbi:MAG: 50S ribosomal protein L13 [Myxococcota bacterium]|nr:50S ribosomal protein L13 [Myxococcota bacterium]MDW8362326.1 50S ribosomal protein L13 [Myxococcales bacterium]